MENKIKIYTDGGSRGNPGPSAIGVVIDLGGDVKEYSQYLGRATNNESEYHAVIYALKKVKLLIGKSLSSKATLNVFVDSELLANQVNMKYKVKDREMQQLFMELWNLQMDFKKVNIKNVPRAENKTADMLVNQELDKELKGKLKI